jgi:hypothetical protein
MGYRRQRLRQRLDQRDYQNGDCDVAERTASVLRQRDLASSHAHHERYCSGDERHRGSGQEDEPCGVEDGAVKAVIMRLVLVIVGLEGVDDLAYDQRREGEGREEHKPIQRT